MRTAKTMAAGMFRLPFQEAWKTKKPDTGMGRKLEQTRNKIEGSWRIVALFGVLFFAGYVGGIWRGRLGSSIFGEELAAYYMDPENFSSFPTLFLNLFGGAFLQVTLVLLCGFSALGSAFLPLYFAARGVVLGICVAGIFVRGGTRALVIYWLLTCLPDLGIFLVMLWLAIQAHICAFGLLRSLLGTGARRHSQMPVKKLIIRFVTAILLCAGCSLLGAASGVLFAGALL